MASSLEGSATRLVEPVGSGWDVLNQQPVYRSEFEDRAPHRCLESAPIMKRSNAYKDPQFAALLPDGFTLTLFTKTHTSSTLLGRRARLDH